MSNTIQHDILIIGGGAAGISVSARLIKRDPSLDVAIIEPSDKHYYQPLWTLVGGGVFRKDITEKNQSEVIPKGVKWIRDAVSTLQPELNTLTTRDGKKIQYRNLVVAPGLQVDWDRIAGLKDTIGKNGVVSIYDYRYVDATWQAIRHFKGGTAIFTFPATPVKCGGAPQKIMYLAEHHFRRVGVRQSTRVKFISAGAGIFAVKRYADALLKVIEKRKIETLFKHNLVEIKAQSREAIFESMETGEKVTVNYDLLHVTPPMSGPDFIKRSSLANTAGWVDVDKGTLQHTRYPNVFGLGDASSLPTSKTGAAIRHQAPVLVQNLLSLRADKEMASRYNGYTSCPLVTGYGKLILAEFDYDGNPQETFPWDQSKERLSMYLLKKYLLPRLYWQGMLKGRA